MCVASDFGRAECFWQILYESICSASPGVFKKKILCDWLNVLVGWTNEWLIEGIINNDPWLHSLQVNVFNRRSTTNPSKSQLKLFDSKRDISSRLKHLRLISGEFSRHQVSLTSLFVILPFNCSLFVSYLLETGTFWWVNNWDWRLRGWRKGDQKLRRKPLFVPRADCL